MTAADPRSQQLAQLTECAYRLGLAFGAEAERAGEHARQMEYFQLFDRCFFSVRVAIGLQLRLRREPAALRPEAETEREERAERDPSEHDPSEHDPSEHGGLERDAFEYDRDREREIASLPVLLKTLGGVCADAAALPGPEPAALPTLRELLAEVTADPTPAAAPRGAGGLRARLAGSGAATVMTLAPPLRGGLGVGPPLRRATGPPRR